jgi:hypothetical protein
MSDASGTVTVVRDVSAGLDFVDSVAIEPLLFAQHAPEFHETQYGNVEFLGFIQ